MRVEPIKHKDVRGKELLYVKFVNSKGTELLVNVGEKTYEKLQQMVTEEEVKEEQKTTKK